MREIAATIGRHLGIPAVSLPADQAADHFKAFPFITMDITMPGALTRELLGWQPTRPGLIADLDEGHYFAAPDAVAPGARAPGRSTVGQHQFIDVP